MNASTNLNSLSIGTNLSEISPWSTQYPFIDYFKNARNWITHTEGIWDTQEYDLLELDEFGWVKSLPNSGDDVQYNSVVTSIPNPHDGTRFVVLYDGEGTIEYSGGAIKDEAASSLGRHVFAATPDRTLNLKITQTDPHNTGNYIRNIRVVPEQYADIYDSVIFNPDFLEKIDDFEAFRFMEWMKTNNSQQGEWSERPTIDSSTYVDQGVPVEIMVELANQTGIDPWFTLPHLATDEYITNFAQIVKENLNPELDVYIEFSNEIWNSNFEQSQWVEAQGKQDLPDVGGSDYANRLDWYSQRTTEMTQIWEQVFDLEQDRVIGILSAQATNPWTGRRVLEYQWASDSQTHQDYGIDAIAIAPYFGNYLGSAANVAEVESWTNDPDGGLDKLFTELSQGGVLSSGPEGGALQEAYERMEAYVDLAQQQGLQLFAYEGGQHLVGHGEVKNNQTITDLFIAANRDPRMGDLYREYLTSWNEVGGDLFLNYKDISKPNKWGSWGILENALQESSPKYDAVMELTGNSKQINEPSLSLAVLLIGITLVLKVGRRFNWFMRG